MEKQIDIGEIFKYLLFSEPTCFAYRDGNILDSLKPRVQSFLKEQLNSHPPCDTDAAATDVCLSLGKTLQGLLPTKVLSEMC